MHKTEYPYYEILLLFLFCYTEFYVFERRHINIVARIDSEL